mgnify:CR=1 FL=1|tara:strand:+ start:243672 stop:248357 length:4686 start_codon:yes stop_codon:yes gene_type:complete
MKQVDIPYYEDYISPSLRAELLSKANTYSGVEGLVEVGTGGGLEDKESLKFLCELYEELKGPLNKILNQRIKDRDFIDKRVKACYEFNKTAKNDFITSKYETIIGLEDSDGRIVMGPLRKDYYRGNENKVAPIPEYLKGNHITLFGPPESAKLSINAMNAYHRSIKDEPAVISELLKTHESLPKWGADDEDSKTPLRSDLASAGANLTECFEGTLRVEDKEKGKVYELAKDKLSLPIKRFPGLALPSTFLFYRENPLPLHLYDFALHFFHNWHNSKALAFYVPKLENEEEARYIKLMMETAEQMIKAKHPEYKLGTIRLLIVLENPRAVFRVNEMMDELYPYFAGASLGWHDYLGSTARLFKEDPNYRIPVKADPDIVIKHIKGSHQLLADVVGPRGGIKIGGMYGILPITSDIHSNSFQVAIFGFIKDVVTQMKRGLDGFWVAHPDFMRIGLALVEAWKHRVSGDKTGLEKLVKSLLHDKYHQDIFNFIEGDDIKGLDYNDELYDRDLIVADIAESSYMKNNDPIEVGYNIFQSLQYITDWLSGNGCVALPAIVGGEAVRVMDDLATAERSRWEVWHEIHHGRFSLEEFFKIAHEEMNFIRKDLSDERKIVQVKWNDRTAKWYPIAMKLMIKLMTDKEPVEFATELLLPFGIETVRNSKDPWAELSRIDPDKFKLDLYTERFQYFFEMCGSIKFAKKMASCAITNMNEIKKSIFGFNKQDIIDAASFHGNIGESKKTLDAMAQSEQSKVFDQPEELTQRLLQRGNDYLNKFGVKFLVSAKGKTGKQMLDILESRFNNTEEQELENAREALFEITRKRVEEHPLDLLKKKIEDLLDEYSVKGCSIAVSTGLDKIQSLALGHLDEKQLTSESSLFEIASLSKTIGSAFAIEYFSSQGINLDTSVNKLLKESGSDFILERDDVLVKHLMSHSALNMHYVNGIPADRKMPKIEDFLNGNDNYGYEKIKVINEPGKVFKYSGAGFILLEHLIEAHSKKSIKELTKPFLKALEMNSFTFEQETMSESVYASGFLADNKKVEGDRKMFPAFAAGAMSNAYDVSSFLNSITKAFHNLDGVNGLSNDTAVSMLYGTNKGCQEFMGANMGLGVFVAQAGPNKLALHQGANDGFRSIYVHCYEGPDLGKGFTLLCNADNIGVIFLSKVSQLILKNLDMEGIDTSLFKNDIDFKNIPQEELVNFGYKNMVFNSFKPTLPEEIVEHGPVDSLSTHSLLNDAEVESVTNQLFARAENLISKYEPVFDPTLFGKQGKVMDSWESVRHNLRGVDSLVLSLKNEISPKYALISTKWHLGNHAPQISIDGLDKSNWIEVLSNVELDGHSELRIKLENLKAKFNKIKVNIYPDGGLTRLYLFDDSLPENEIKTFKELSHCKSKLYPEPIPHTTKPMHIPFSFSKDQVECNFKSLKDGELYDIASTFYGGAIEFASNEHYGPATQIISPYPPLSMFDGLESARSREEGHYDEVVIKFLKSVSIETIEVDFTYFVNNNPLDIEVFGRIGTDFIELATKQRVKGFAGKKKAFSIKSDHKFDGIKIKCIPDGGMNRVKVFTIK